MEPINASYPYSQAEFTSTESPNLNERIRAPRIDTHPLPHFNRGRSGHGSSKPENDSPCTLVAYNQDQTWNPSTTEFALQISALPSSELTRHQGVRLHSPNDDELTGQLGDSIFNMDSFSVPDDDEESLCYPRSRFSSWTTVPEQDDTVPLLPSRVKHMRKTPPRQQLVVRRRSFQRKAITTPSLYSQPSTDHLNSLTQALQVMNTDLRFNIASLESSFLRNADAGLKYHPAVNLPPGLFHACERWGYHLEASSSDTLEERLPSDLVDEFLETKFLFWLEVLSFTGGVERAIPVLQALARRECRKGLGSWLQCFLSSAIEFIDQYTECINMSTPHIYVSCFLFPPPPHQLNLFFNHYAIQLRNVLVNGDSPVPQNAATDRYSIIKRWSRLSTVSTSSAPEKGQQTVLKMNTSGWILGPKRELLLWVPERHRVDLWGEGERREGRFAVQGGEDVVHADVSRLSTGREWLTYMDVHSE